MLVREYSEMCGEGSVNSELESTGADIPEASTPRGKQSLALAPLSSPRFAGVPGVPASATCTADAEEVRGPPRKPLTSGLTHVAGIQQTKSAAFLLGSFSIPPAFSLSLPLLCSWL